MKLIVLNLSRDTTNQELEALFTRYGTVVSCQLVIDKETGGSKGFGFVEMQETSEGEAAIAGLHGTRVDKHKIRVKLSSAL